VQLISLGDLSLDIVVSAASPMATGSDVGGTIAFRVGGSAANVARAFVAAGGHAAFVGAVGDDAMGKRLVGALRRSRVYPFVVRRPGRSAQIAVILSEDGQRSFVTDRGVADLLSTVDLVREWFRGLRALHVPAYSLLSQPLGSAAALAAEWAREERAIVSVDLASAEPIRRAGAARVRRLVAELQPDVLFANQDEADALGDPDALAGVVVIKLGSVGCRVNGVAVPTERVASTDTTGAGDAFDAGFLFAWLAGADGVEAAVVGHAAARKLLTEPRSELLL
jgi:sugar/nucleoside kinase (ribokinase family)